MPLIRVQHQTLLTTVTWPVTVTHVFHGCGPIEEDGLSGLQ